MNTPAPHMAITVEVRSVFGQTKVYPVCATAQAFAEIAGTATLTHRTLCQIERLGYEIISIANAVGGTVPLIRKDRAVTNAAIKSLSEAFQRGDVR